MKAPKPPVPADDKTLQAVKRSIQAQSRDAVNSGRLRQSDLFLIKPEVARRAKVKLKA